MVNLIQQNVVLQWCVSQENTFPLALLSSNNSHWPIDHRKVGVFSKWSCSTHAWPICTRRTLSLGLAGSLLLRLTRPKTFFNRLILNT